MKTANEILAVVFLFVVKVAINWAMAVAVYKLLTMCFGWPFSWAIATGVWLLWRAAWMLFGGNGKKRHD